MNIMEWALVICSILVILIGYRVIKSVEKTIHHKSNLPKQEAEAEPEPVIPEGKPFVLLYGISKLADELVLLLKEYNIDFLQIEDQSQLDPSKNYTHLFAVSGSDLDNLLINTLVNRINRTHKRIAVCNNADNLGIYHQSDISSINTDNLEAETMFQMMFPAYIR